MKNLLKNLIIMATLAIMLTACQSCEKDNTPSVTTVSVTIVAANQNSASITATGQLNSDGGAPTTRYGFCLGKAINPTMNDSYTSTTTLGPNGTFTLTFGALDYSATYHVRAYAVNSEGVGYGNDISIETIPTAITLTKEATNVTLTAATLNGVVNPKGKATKVWFEYSGDELTKLNHTIQAGTFSDNSEINVSAQISDLTAAKVYNFTVKSENISGVAEGEVMSFETYAASDIDGNFYHSIKIGDQIWLKENLMVTHYNDGSDIPNVTDNTAWMNLNTGAYCDFNNDPEISKVYGRLYNAYACYTGKLAPAGWHVANDDDWMSLLYFVDRDGGALKETGTKHWQAPNTGATNSTGFTALAGGTRNAYNTGQFENFQTYSGLWSATPYPSGSTIVALSHVDDFMDARYAYSAKVGAGVRLIKD